jgi:hypothetical protein
MIPDTRRTSSLLRPGLRFRYTQRSRAAVNVLRRPGKRSVADKASAFDQRLQLRPHYRGMHAAIMHSRRKPAVDAGDHVFWPHQFGEAYHAFGNERGMFNNVCGVADNARDQLAAGREYDMFSDPAFVLVTNWCDFCVRLQTLVIGKCMAPRE